MLRARPSDRYSTVKTIFQHSAVKPDLEATFASMRDVDATYQVKHYGPSLGAAAFAEAVQVQAELLWAQRSNKENKGGDVDWKADMVCYNCQPKGHFSTECSIQTKNCNFCHRRGHTEAECRTKLRVQKEKGENPTPSPLPSPQPSLNLLYHGEACMAAVTQPGHKHLTC